MKVNTEGFNDKASTRPEERRLYEEAPDYVSAYAAHTDLRVARDGPHRAIGSKTPEDYEDHGRLQLEFLQSVGVTPWSRVCDFGCGTGRLARHLVPFLYPNHYFGIDISPAALDQAATLAVAEGWHKKLPRFFKGDGTLAPVRDEPLNLIWAHSVFTHLPEDLIDKVLADVAAMQVGQFYFTYKRADSLRRTGLKQFAYNPGFFYTAAQRHGLRAEEVDMSWPGGQRTMVVRRK